MVVPVEIKTFAMADSLHGGVKEEEVTSPVDRNEKIQLSTLDPMPSPENLTEGVDASRDDNNETFLDANCHDGDRLPTCCVDSCDRGIDKLLCKTDDILNVEKLAEYLCGPDPCFEVGYNANCGEFDYNAICGDLEDADDDDDDNTAFQFNVKCGKLGDAGVEIKHQKNKEQADITQDSPGENVIDGSAKVSTDEILVDEAAPANKKEADEAAAVLATDAARSAELKKEKLGENVIDDDAKVSEDEIPIDEAVPANKSKYDALWLEQKIAKLEVEKERADEAAAVAAAAAAAAARSAKLKKEQQTNQDERIAWLKSEFERLEQEYAAAEKKN